VSIVALIVGRLVADPERRTAGSGREYTRARLLIAGPDAGASHVLVSAFGATTQAVWMGLRAGACVAISGSLKVSVWVPPDGGEPRVNLMLSCDSITTLHEHQRAGRAVRAARAERDAAAPPPAPPPGPAPANAARSQQQARALWQPGAGGTGSGFDDMKDDTP